MGKYFNDVVEKAIEDIYYCCDNEKAVAAAKALAEATNSGDGDAAYLLSRCCSGPEYSWEYHTFAEDDDAAESLIKLSVSLGSAMGVLGAMRIGMLTPGLQEAMPFDSIKQAWDVVYKKAEDGCAFCQNMIGNTYFWLDIVEIEGKGPESFPNKKAYNEYLRENMLKSIPWYEKSFTQMSFAGRNMFNFYFDGEEDLIKPEPAKAWEVAALGAKRGYPEWEKIHGVHLLEQEGRESEGLAFCERAAKKGHLSACYHAGKAYQEGEIVAKDIARALYYYEMGANDEEPGCANGAGEIYYLGEDGVAQDYAKAVRYFEMGHERDSLWGNDMLGICYLFGNGCRKDVERARELFEEADYSSDLTEYGLGLIYCEGMGVDEDIKKGVAHLLNAKDYQPAQEELMKFKKTILGKWVRR